MTKQKWFTWFLNVSIIILGTALVLVLFLSIGGQNAEDFVKDMF